MAERIRARVRCRSVQSHPGLAPGDDCADRSRNIARLMTYPTDNSVRIGHAVDGRGATSGNRRKNSHLDGARAERSDGGWPSGTPSCEAVRVDSTIDLAVVYFFCTVVDSKQNKNRT